MSFGHPGAASSRRFLFSRLHSLAGIVPLGLFLLEHFYSNGVAMLGGEQYNLQIERLHSIPFLWLLEIVLVAIPLLYHAGYGIYTAFAARYNLGAYSYWRNWLFFLQRVSGMITLVFVAYHLWSLRLANLFFGVPIHFDTVQDHLSSPFVFVFYVIGVVAATFHFTNGLASGLVTWGITIGKRSQRIASYAMFALFVVLSAFGIGTLMAF